MDTDIAIIGGGPVGSLAAYNAVKKGSSVTIYDQRKEIGVPDHCAGLLSISGLKQLGLDDLPKEVIMNQNIKGARFFSPSGISFEIQRKKDQAYVVNRTLFDQYLLERAINKGVKINNECKVSDLIYNKSESQITIKYKDLTVKELKKNTAFVGIISTGTRKYLLNQMKLSTIPPKCFIPGYQLLIENITDLDPRFVELYISNNFAPGFFAWIIPIDETTAKVGLASKEKFPTEKMNYFLKKYPATKDRFTHLKIIEKYSGLVITNGTRRKTVFNGFIIAGDAAGQTKSTTGGGVITGGLAGAIAGTIAAEAVENNDNSKKFLKSYDKQWKELLWKQLKSMAKFRWLANKLSNKALDLAFEAVLKNDLVHLIEETGDIDKQANVLQSLLKHPAVIKLGFKILPYLNW
ncbi:MAG: NAD(P)/FAD-dependent oxidoreductase [Candidatus Heimdallarchaeota archaeon]|nr:NAD(P)/FAD-dependent oxidoreductase [Candidatus Heimdallarchaeota archaeon]